MNIQRLVLLDDTPAARPVRLPDKDAVRYEVFKEPHNAVDDCPHLRIRRIIRSVVVEVSVSDGPNVDREFIAIVKNRDIAYLRMRGREHNRSVRYIRSELHARKSPGKFGCEQITHHC